MVPDAKIDREYEAYSAVVAAEYASRRCAWQDGTHYAPTNNNRPPFMVGLTGLRGVGKSSVADILEAEHGFNRAHAFDGGKEMASTYFAYITKDTNLAERMVFGDLKDVPCPDLPGGVAPRHFLEKFGHFMGAVMGVEWTLAMEVRKLTRAAPEAPIVVESLVYEAAWFRANGGVIVRVVRPGHVGPSGVESDEVQAAITADHTLVNDGDLASLQGSVASMLWSIGRSLRAAA